MTSLIHAATCYAILLGLSVSVPAAASELKSSWAHLAVSDDEVFVRDLKGLSVYRWNAAPAHGVTK